MSLKKMLAWTNSNSGPLSSPSKAKNLNPPYNQPSMADRQLKNPGAILSGLVIAHCVTRSVV